MGVLNSNTFSDFFKNKFRSERAILQFNPHHFKQVFEMAVPGVGDKFGDVSKVPINIDKDDIAFLEQFPRNLWNKALHKRWEMLHDAISKLHEKRMGMGFHELWQKLEQVLLKVWNGDQNAWNDLNSDVQEGKLSQDVLNRMRRHFTTAKINSMGESHEGIKKAIKDEAHKEAYEEVKSRSEGIDDDKPVTFSFGRGEDYVAHPYLNRLYHKVERTKGQEHHPSSGLRELGTDQGQYGYDLGFPSKRDIKTNDSKGKEKVVTKRNTRGMGGWPELGTVNSAVGDLMNLNHHGIFGDLKIPPDAHWLPIKGHVGGKAMRDNWIWNKTYNNHYKSIYPLVSNGQMDDAETKFGTETQKRAEASRLAKEATMRDALAGKMHSPPIPSQNPDGSPVLDEKGQPIDPNNRVVKVIGLKKGKSEGSLNPDDYEIEFPLVYLPHVKKTVNKKTPDGVQPVKEDIPIINPATYFRALGTEESDFIHDENGKNTGEINHVGLGDRLTGHDKNYVRVEPHEYVKNGRGHLAPSAFNPNQMSKGRYFISRGDEKFQDYYDQVFGSMNNYNDFKKGINYCLVSSKCGGATQQVKNVMKGIEGSILNTIVAIALNDLRNPSLQTEEGRINYAFKFTSEFAQFDHGTGTRRRRIIDPSMMTVSRDMTTSGKEGDMGIGDTLDAQTSADKYEKALSAGRAQGDKIFKNLDWAIMGSSAYDVNRIRETFSSLEQEAAEADKAEKTLSITPEDVDKLQELISDRNNIMQTMKMLLTKIYSKKFPDKTGMSIEKDVDDEIKAWVKDGHYTAQQLVNKFKAHPYIKEVMGITPEMEDQQQAQNPQPEKSFSPEVEEAAKFAWEEIKPSVEKWANSGGNINALKAKDEPYSATLAAMVKSYKPANRTGPEEGFEALDIEEDQAEEVLAAMQQLLNKDLLSKAPQQTPQPQVQPATQVPPKQERPAAAASQTAMAARDISNPKPKPPGATRNPESDREPIHRRLWDKGLYLDYILHPNFVNHPAHIDSLPVLQKGMDKWKNNGWITPEEYSQASQNIQKAYATHNRNANVEM